MSAEIPVLGPEHLTNCATCNEYLERRLTRVVEELVVRTFSRPEETFPWLVRYVHGVHKRHLAGLSLGAPS